MVPLFEHYPRLAEKIPYISLGNLPSPVQKATQLGADIGVNSLYIKRDDLSGKIYGGNKVRKLEFLLGQALCDNAQEVLTFGYAGSNHACATAIYAKEVGLTSISMLLPQPNAHYVRKNLLMSHYAGAELHQYRNTLFGCIGSVYQLLRHKRRYGQFPFIIPPGGSSCTGITGFVNAAFELREQIKKGELPEPDYIYVALGTMGTAIGLALGMKAAELKTRVIGVRVVDEKFANLKKMTRLFYNTNSMLHSHDNTFPLIEFSEKDLEIRHGYMGQHYALFTEGGMKAAQRMIKHEGLMLEGTYTAKTVSALIDDGEDQILRDKVVLFWNTYNSHNLSSIVDTIDYHTLPQAFHYYFEEEVQALDRNYFHN
ncbi:MAG: 1-aminocyclopropane-1-carboxylate deaminase/D-cysteine desulfhydrase [bacterium]